jgi:hypothetical protein
VAFGCDVDLNGHIIEDTTRGIMTGWTDVTAHAAIPNGSLVPVDLSANYTAILAAITAANNASTGNKVVWFPANASGSTYCFSCSGVDGLPIYPGLTYKCAPGVTIRRYDGETAATDSIFTTKPSGSAVGTFADTTTVFDGFTFNCRAASVGFSAIYLTQATGAVNGRFVIRNCRFNDCYYPGQVRYAVYSDNAEYLSVRNCKFVDVTYAVYAKRGCKMISGCRNSFGGRTSVDTRGIVLIDSTSGDAGAYSQVTNCHTTGSFAASHISIHDSSRNGRHTLIGNSTTAYPVLGGSSSVWSMVAESARVSIMDNIVTPDLSAANADIPIGITVPAGANWGRNCIVGNSVGPLRPNNTYKVRNGISTYACGLGDNRVLGNIITSYVTTALAVRGRDSTSPATDLLADVTRYDYENTGVTVCDPTAIIRESPDTPPPPPPPGGGGRDET